MPLFDSATIERFFNQGENLLSKDYPFLVDRYSIPIVSGTSTYTLPSYCFSIRRITYRGMKLDPLPQRNFREVFQSATQQGRPWWYIFNNVGQNKIQLFPCPSENLAATLTPWTSISDTCIVEFYRATDNSTFTIPAYNRNQMLKRYLAHMCYLVEGAGQNLKLAAYFGNKWDELCVQFKNHMNELHNKPRKLIVNEIVSSNYFPASPVLPINRFGVSVDEGC